MRRKRLLIFLAILVVLFAVCALWACLDRLSWIRFTMTLPLPGFIKMLLWGWF